ncbi:endonuclease III domain-containing protein [Silvibacterium sp.]|uniref:endonuclease III domain-containing protein n=1 Tax=Silvibacterium sp. TaxID=1964179 RepID=UPI0039E6CCE7
MPVQDHAHRYLLTMTLPLFQDGRLEALHNALLAAYGPPPPREPWPPLRQFIYSMLSSRTKTETSHEVLYALERHFGSWEKVRDASPDEVLHIVAPATFAEEKAPWLQKALRRITRQNGGRLNLDFLHGESEQRIRRWLESFDGVGPKTSAAVVNFSTIRGSALVIDSHHQRIAERLRLVPKGTPTATTEQKLRDLAPVSWGPEMLDDHHRLVKLHGQRACTALDWERNCSRCPLLSMCPTGEEVLAGRRTLVLDTRPV